MSRIKVLIMVLIVAIFLSACAPKDPGPVPTLISLPDVTQTFTPSPTFTATATHTLTPTHTPTYTATFTPTKTATVTNTFVPTATYTSTITPSPTATATSTAVPATATPLEPLIVSFTSSGTSSEPGKPLTLTWQTQADSARIERLVIAGTIVETIPIQTNGTMTVTVPGGEARVIYRLVAIRGGRETSLSLAIAVAAVCPSNWFFSPIGQLPCAAGVSVLAPAAFQTFQQGYMFHIQVNNQNKVCGIQFNLNLYTCYPYVAYNGTPPATPPAGFQAPGADLADAFYNQLAIGGYWYTVIGWGTNLMSTGSYTTQSDVNGQLYIQLPVGIYRFDAQLSNGTATKIQ